jgi:hypothetical protein
MAQDLPKLSLLQVIRKHLGDDFPVSGGTNSPTDPIVITASIDYVSAEYAVARLAAGLRGENFQLIRQASSSFDGRMVDELTFKATKAGDADWETERKFYFDVTVGFSNL